jgi:hypothetical protein
VLTVALTVFFLATSRITLDLEVALGQELLQPRVLLLELSQTLHVRRLELTEPLARRRSSGR